MLNSTGDNMLPVFTIGYGARSLEAFLAVLHAQDVAYLIDVRSAPYSKFKPEFSKSALEAAAKVAGLTYVYLGDTLGGQPKDQSCYEDGKVLYDRVKERAFFREGIARLRRRRTRLAGSGHVQRRQARTVPPHRLDRQALVDAGVPVVHIDENDCRSARMMPWRGAPAAS